MSTSRIGSIEYRSDIQFEDGQPALGWYWFDSTGIWIGPHDTKDLAVHDMMLVLEQDIGASRA